MSQGRVKPGWYGDMVALVGPGVGTRANWDPQTGQPQRQHQQRSGVGRAPGAILLMPWPTTTMSRPRLLHRQCYTGTQNPLLSG